MESHAIYPNAHITSMRPKNTVTVENSNNNSKAHVLELRSGVVVIVRQLGLRWGIVVRVRCLLLLSSEYLFDAQNNVIHYLPHILQVEKKQKQISMKGACFNTLKDWLLCQQKLHLFHQTNYLLLDNSIDHTHLGAVVVMTLWQ